MKERKLRILTIAIGICFALSLVALIPTTIAVSDGVVVVIGQGDPNLSMVHPLYGTPCTEDIYNVQNAILDTGYDTVVLKGDFCFDTEVDVHAGVYVRRSVTITGDGKTVGESGSRRAATTIRNSGLWGAFVVMTGGVTVSDLSIFTDGFGIEVGFAFSDERVTIKDNYIDLDAAPLLFPGGTYCIGANYFDCPLYITNNRLRATDHGDGYYANAMSIASFDAGLDFWLPPYPMQLEGVPVLIPDSPNQHEVVITENDVYCTGPEYTWGGRIRIGHSGGGLNKVHVGNNVLTGFSLMGIEVSPYVTDCTILGNDLSGLTATDVQIGIFGSRTICMGNVLGKVVKGPTSLFATGIAVVNVNWHPPLTPSWHTQCNLVMMNDFRRTGLPGWTFDSEGKAMTRGCVLVGDLGAIEETPYGTSGLSCRNNLVFEAGRFTRGTGGAKSHVWVVESDLTYDNWVIGFRPP